jgi:hypothetical protein
MYRHKTININFIIITYRRFLFIILQNIETSINKKIRKTIIYLASLCETKIKIMYLFSTKLVYIEQFKALPNHSYTFKKVID